MEKGFGLIIFVLIILVLLMAVAGGFWMGRKSLTMGLNNSISSTLTKQNQATSSAQGTVFMKRSFDPTQGFYPDKPLPQEITGVAEQNLVGFNCDGPYMETQTGQYLWGIQLEDGLYYKPMNEELAKFTADTNTNLEQVGTKRPAAYISYCVTENGGKYLLVGQYLGGGGAGTDTHIFDLNHGIGGPLSGLIKSEPWPYFGCSNIMQITKEAMYIACSAGDSGFSGHAIYRKDLFSNQVATVMKCTNQMSEDMTTSNVVCQ